ncbi:MAG: MBL fold metallo-hydrolase [Candidatus Portnoybacteria bacterium]|nr:MBL fold metallo-hydrolase [Candidatus Portnoybacteria bacterium]MDD4982603.1 MBL fold metallo-hydrolase [Candidatus Portnoybacteria bacterium]
MWQRLKNKIPYVILATLLLAAVFVWLAILESAPGDKIKISFLDVGQGSAILVNAPNNNQVLIDGGPSDAVLAKLGQALPLFDRKIELLILTHPDSDHLSGLIEVLKRYDVGQILETGIADSTAEYHAWNDLIKQKNIPVVFAQAGDIVKMADDLAIEILYPFGKINGRDFSKNTNSTSIVGKIRYGKNALLFTGDAEGNVEEPLVFAGINLKADILAVGHHGGKNSTSPEFLAAVAPKIAVIQVGAKNKYGHPAPEVLDRLKGLDIFRTDMDKDVAFECGLAICQKER